MRLSAEVLISFFPLQVRRLYESGAYFNNYYTLIFPYLNYAVVVWGNSCNKFKQVMFSSKQMHSMCVFIVESSKVLYKLLDILKFDNIVELSTSVLAHKIFNKSSSIPSLFYDSLRAASNLHKYNTRYPFKGNFHRPKVRTTPANLPLHIQPLN